MRKGDLKPSAANRMRLRRSSASSHACPSCMLCVKHVKHHQLSCAIRNRRDSLTVIGGLRASPSRRADVRELPGGYSTYHRIFLHVPVHNSSSRHNRTLADSDALKHYRASADPHLVLYHNSLGNMTTAFAFIEINGVASGFKHDSRAHQTLPAYQYFAAIGAKVYIAVDEAVCLYDYPAGVISRNSDGSCYVAVFPDAQACSLVKPRSEAIEPGRRRKSIAQRNKKMIR